MTITHAVGRKQLSSTEDFWHAFETIRDTYPEDRLRQKEDAMVAHLREVAAGKRVAYSWSGGKDSVVLGHLAERAGIYECILAICNLEFPEFLAWVTDHMPHDLEVVNTGQDLDWLVDRPELLFPQTAQTAMRWFRAVQHTAQRAYFRRWDLDLLLMGRRWADGNYTGRGREKEYTDRTGTHRYSPIADWSHEDVLASIAWNNLPLAPFYRWPRGFRVGTNPWPARQWTRNVEHGWNEVYSIDPEVVRVAAAVLPSAQEYLERV